MGNPCWLVYGPILVLLVAGLAVRHARSPVPTARSKRGVVVATAGACLLAVAWPAAHVAATVVLTGVGAYLLLYREVVPLEPDHPDRAESDREK